MKRHAALADDAPLVAEAPDKPRRKNERRWRATDDGRGEHCFPSPAIRHQFYLSTCAATLLVSGLTMKRTSRLVRVPDAAGRKLPKG